MTIQTDLLGARVKIDVTENQFVPKVIQGQEGTIRSVYLNDGSIAYTVDVGGNLFETWSWAFTILEEKGKEEN